VMLRVRVIGPATEEEFVEQRQLRGLAADIEPCFGYLKTAPAYYVEHSQSDQAEICAEANA